MNKEISKTMHKFTEGKLTLEEANKELKEQEASFHIDPLRNVLTEAEIEETLVGTYPRQATGWGLLDTGTGSLDKVEVVKGQLVDCDCGEMYALIWIAGRCYKVDGKTLVA